MRHDHIGMKQSFKRILLTLLLLIVSFYQAAAVEILAHRSSRGLWPENSMEAIVRTIAMGIDTLELDLAVTKDLEVVLHHDPYLSFYLVQDPEGLFIENGEDSRLIKDLTFEEIQEYTIGEIRPETYYYWVHRNQEPIPDQKIPKLADVFAYVATNLGMEIDFSLEIKTFPTYPHLTHDLQTVAKAVIDVVREYHMEEYVTIISFDWNTLSVVREIAPEIEIGCVASTRSRFRGSRMNLRLFERGASPWLSGLDADDYSTIPDLVNTFGATKLYLNYLDLKPSDLVRSRELGLELIVWTVNSKLRMNQFAQWGVDGIITDRPDLLREVVEQRGDE